MGSSGGPAAGRSAEDIYKTNRKNLEELAKTGYAGLIDDEDRQEFLKELASNDQLGRGSDPWNLENNDVTNSFIRRLTEASSPEYSAKKKERMRKAEAIKIQNDTPGLRAQTILGSSSIAAPAATILGSGR